MGLGGIGRFVLRGLPVALAIIVLAVAFLFLLNDIQGKSSQGKLRVLSYSGFVNSWGAGPEIAKRFLDETGIEIEFHDGGDAGLLLKKLELFPADLVIGFDQATVAEAAEAKLWRVLSERYLANMVEEVRPVAARWLEEGFVAFDWAPMAFVYRQGEIEPPQSLQDLLDERFRGAIALQDPRTSTPGLQFLLWVLAELGVDEGFQFLERLKPNIHSVSAGWSAAYGLFSKKQAKLVFSYLTSPLYHQLEENDSSYKAAVFGNKHPIQVEFVVIPDNCVECVRAEMFVEFLLEPEIQNLIMRKNFMLPVINGGVEGEFAHLPAIGVMNFEKQAELMKQKDELLTRWQNLGL